jgi:hypothetical protein
MPSGLPWAMGYGLWGSDHCHMLLDVYAHTHTSTHAAHRVVMPMVGSAFSGQAQVQYGHAQPRAAKRRAKLGAWFLNAVARDGTGPVTARALSQLIPPIP